MHRVALVREVHRVRHVRDEPRLVGRRPAHLVGDEHPVDVVRADRRIEAGRAGTDQVFEDDDITLVGAEILVGQVNVDPSLTTGGSTVGDGALRQGQGTGWGRWDEQGLIVGRGAVLGDRLL